MNIQLSLFDLLPQPRPRCTVPSIEEQTGWRRPSPQAICQETTVLLAITAYDFESDNGPFADYALARTGLSVDGKVYNDVDPRWFEQLGNHSLTRDAFDCAWRVVGPYGHKIRRGAELFPEELDIKWQIFLLQKGRLHDCWELWTAQQNNG